jgi:hypothetical protein
VRGAGISVLLEPVAVVVAVAFDDAGVDAFTAFGQQVARCGDLGDDPPFGL